MTFRRILRSPEKAIDRAAFCADLEGVGTRNAQGRFAGLRRVEQGTGYFGEDQARRVQVSDSY
jgi:hypothetical protein